MAISLFRVSQGIEIEKDDLTASSAIIIGAGLPGGDGAEQDAAPIGSIYQRTDTDIDGLNLYVKVSTINNSSADWKAQASKSYVDSAIAGLKWREPAEVMDKTAYADSTAFPTTGIVDGVTLVDQDRVLFSNVSIIAERNVWIWNATSSTWTEDTKPAEDGDAILIQQGTYADEQYTFDGTNWIQVGNSGDAAEIAFNRDFMGKTGPGAEMPTYSSTNNVTDGTSLETAIGDLDTAVGNRTYTNDNIVIDGESVAVSLDKIDTAIGNRLYTNNNVVVDGEIITASIDKIDTAVGELQDQNQTSTGTAIDATAGITLDTIPLASASEVKWMIQVRDATIPANRRATELHAMNDGSTLVDHTEYAILKLGSAIPGFNLDVDISGTDMRLRLTASATIDYVVKRISYSTF